MLELPAEIVDQILVKVDGRYASPSLRACALTCRAFARVVQPLLFSAVTIANPRQLARLLDIIFNNPRIGTEWVRELTLFIRSDPWPNSDEERDCEEYYRVLASGRTIRPLFERLSAVETLIMNDIRFNWLELPDDFSMVLETFRSLPSSTISCLQLESVAFTECADMMAFLLLFTEISTLHFDFIIIDYDCEHDENTSLPRNIYSSLKYLSMDRVYTINCGDAPDDPVLLPVVRHVLPAFSAPLSLTIRQSCEIPAIQPIMDTLSHLLEECSLAISHEDQPDACVNLASLSSLENLKLVIHKCQLYRLSRTLLTLAWPNQLRALQLCFHADEEPGESVLTTQHSRSEWNVLDQTITDIGERSDSTLDLSLSCPSGINFVEVLQLTFQSPHFKIIQHMN